MTPNVTLATLLLLLLLAVLASDTHARPQLLGAGLSFGQTSAGYQQSSGYQQGSQFSYGAGGLGALAAYPAPGFGYAGLPYAAGYGSGLQQAAGYQQAGYSSGGLSAGFGIGRR